MPSPFRRLRRTDSYQLIFETVKRLEETHHGPIAQSEIRLWLSTPGTPLWPRRFKTAEDGLETFDSEHLRRQHKAWKASLGPGFRPQPQRERILEWLRRSQQELSKRQREARREAASHGRLDPFTKDVLLRANEDVTRLKTMFGLHGSSTAKWAKELTTERLAIFNEKADAMAAETSRRHREENLQAWKGAPKLRPPQVRHADKWFTDHLDHLCRTGLLRRVATRPKRGAYMVEPKLDLVARAITMVADPAGRPEILGIPDAALSEANALQTQVDYARRLEKAASTQPAATAYPIDLPLVFGLHQKDLSPEYLEYLKRGAELIVQGMTWIGAASEFSRKNKGYPSEEQLESRVLIVAACPSAVIW